MLFPIQVTIVVSLFVLAHSASIPSQDSLFQLLSNATGSLSLSTTNQNSSNETLGNSLVVQCLPARSDPLMGKSCYNAWEKMPNFRKSGTAAAVFQARTYNPSTLDV